MHDYLAHQLQNRFCSRKRRIRSAGHEGVSRRLTNYELLIYASPRYLETHPPIVNYSDFANHDFVGYIEDMLFTPELSYLSLIGANLNPRIRSTNLIT